MANAVFLFEKFSGVYSDGLWQPSLPLANLDDLDLGVVARSVNPINTSTQIGIDLGSAYPIGGIVLCNTNMTPGATYRMIGYTDAARTIVAKDTGIKTVAGSTFDWSDTGTWPPWEDPGFWEGILDITTAKEWPRDLIEIFPADVTARYWLILLFDASNGDGYLQASYLMIARAFRPDKNYSQSDNALSIDFDTATRKSLGGLETFWEKSERRTWRCAFPGTQLPESDLFGQVLKLLKRSKTSRPVYVVPNYDDTTHLRQRSFLARMTSAPALAQANVSRGSTAFDFIEIAAPPV